MGPVVLQSGGHGVDLGPHQRWGRRLRRTSVLPEAKPWRRGGWAAPSNEIPKGTRKMETFCGAAPWPSSPPLWRSKRPDDHRLRRRAPVGPVVLQSGGHGVDLGPHRRWGRRLRRTSVLPEAKPWRRGGWDAPSNEIPKGTRKMETFCGAAPWLSSPPLWRSKRPDDHRLRRRAPLGPAVLRLVRGQGRNGRHMGDAVL